MKRHWRFTRPLLVSIFMIAAAYGDSLADSWLELSEQGKQVRSDTSLSQQEHFEIAQRDYVSALKRLEKALGRDAISTNEMLELFNEIETVLLVQNKYVELEPYLRRKIAIYHEHIGPNAAPSGSAHEELGCLCRQLDRNREAVAEYAQAERINEVTGRQDGAQRMGSKIPALPRDEIRGSREDEEKGVAKDGWETLSASKTQDKESLGRMAELLLITTAFIRLQRYK